MAKHSPKPFLASYLIKAISHLEVVMIKLRLYLDLKLANETCIFQLQSMLMEIGRMLGGWKKATLSS